jgi:hypothetical protein
VGPYLVLRHLTICEDSQEDIDGVVGECAAHYPGRTLSFFASAARVRGLLWKEVEGRSKEASTA